MNNQAQEAARERELRRWEIEQRAIANAKANELEKQRYQDELAQRYNLALKGLEQKSTLEQQREALKREEDAARNERAYANMGLRSEIANMLDETRRAAIDARGENQPTRRKQMDEIDSKKYSFLAQEKRKADTVQSNPFIDTKIRREAMNAAMTIAAQLKAIEDKYADNAPAATGAPAAGTTPVVKKVRKSIYIPETGELKEVVTPAAIPNVDSSDNADQITPINYNPNNE